MSRDEILAMKAGAPMDLLVAEHVLGWVAWEEIRGDYTYIVFQRQGEREPYRKSQRWETEKDRYRIIPFSEIDRMKHIVAGLKDWSTDISAAWEVVEKIKSELQDVMIHDDPYHGCKVTISLISWAKAKTAPEAICKAALLAVLDE